MEAPVLFEEVACPGGRRVGVATLNAPKSLNALTLTMVELMLGQLRKWQGDEGIACVYIKGAGEKAFCAGGDVQALYRSATQAPGGPCEYAETFFEKEYQLDYLLHEYPKPVVCWGGGIVMGGGLGIFAACSHRIVTEKTRLAMPEVTIGLYPDVGGSWFLNKMPDNIGVFLALTGVPINSADSLFLGIADYFITGPMREDFSHKLCSQPWSHAPDDNHDLLDRLLRDFSSRCARSLPASNVEKHRDTINSLCAAENIAAIVEAIGNLESDDAWLVRARKTLLAGSSLSAQIIHQQLQHSRELSLADVFRSELVLSTNIVRHPEFAEGVRALLIDKDNNPRWQYSQVREIPDEVVGQFFAAPEFPAPWPSNPLDRL